MILIHPIGAKKSDPSVKKWFVDNAPVAYNNAQTIVLMARKCAKPPGLFSNPAKHIHHLQEASESLCAAIGAYQLQHSDGSTMSPSDVMNLFSDVHPNWQKEFEWLNRSWPFFSDDFDIDNYLVMKFSTS